MNEEIRIALNSMCKLGQDKSITFTSSPSKFKAQVSLVGIVKTALSLSDEAGYGFKWYAGKHYIFTGMYWQQISKKQIMQYLSAIAKLGQVPESEAYYDRFAIIPFSKCFKGEARDESLEHKIVQAEADGVLSWIIEGAKRLMAQGKFSHAQEMDDALDGYKVESDSVASFLDENNYVSDNEEIISLQHIFDEYNSYCKNSHYLHLYMKNSCV